MSAPPNKESFKREVFRWARKLRVSPRSVRVLGMSRKWASCSSSGTVSFSEDSLMLPPRLRRYVIAHELLHLRAPNHGKLFKALLSAHLPGWRKAHADLRQWDAEAQNGKVSDSRPKSA